MNEEVEITTEEDMEKNNENWKMYELLVGHLHHCHSRLVDNYRVFLTFNSLLIPAITALLVYIIKNQTSLDSSDKLFLRLAAFVICCIGFYITQQGAGLVCRVLIDSEIRINQITRLEKEMDRVTLHPFIEAGEFFFKKKALPNGIEKENGLSLLDFGKSIRAKDAYKHSSYAIYLAYTLLAIFSIYPLLGGLLAVICKTVQYKSGVG